MKIWMRVGMTVDITKEEADAIFDESNRQLDLVELIKEGRAVPDGETYIPFSCVEDFNEENGTDYPCYDTELYV